MAGCSAMTMTLAAARASAASKAWWQSTMQWLVSSPRGLHVTRRPPRSAISASSSSVSACIHGRALGKEASSHSSASHLSGLQAVAAGRGGCPVPRRPIQRDPAHVTSLCAAKLVAEDEDRAWARAAPLARVALLLGYSLLGQHLLERHRALLVQL